MALGSRSPVHSSRPGVILVDQPTDDSASSDVSDVCDFGNDTDRVRGGKVDATVRLMRVVVLFEP